MGDARDARDLVGGADKDLNLPTRVDMIARYVREYSADGFLINSVKSCNSFSVGQLLVLRQLEEMGFCAPGEGGAFVEGGALGAEQLERLLRSSGLTAIATPLAPATPQTSHPPASDAGHLRPLADADTGEVLFADHQLALQHAVGE